jgi:hypothetical protein
VISQSVGTIHFWYKRTGTPANYAGLLNVETAGNNSPHELWLVNWSGMAFHPNWDQSLGRNWNFGAWDTVAPLNTWVAITVSWDNTAQEIRGYINGKSTGSENGSGAWTAAAWTASEGISIGGSRATGSYQCSGVIAECDIWSRVLAPSEAERLHERPNDMLTRRPTQVAVLTSGVTTPASVTEAAESGDTFEATVVSPTKLVALDVPAVSHPSYKQGFATGDDSVAPGLWNGLVGLWAPILGPTGLTLRDQSAFQNHGTLTSMDPASDWVSTEKGWGLEVTDGSSEAVATPVLPVYTSQTLAVRFRHDASTGTKNIVSNYSGNGSEAILLALTNGNLWWAHDRNWVINATTKTYTAGEWGLVVLVYDEATGTTVYNDGAVVDTDGATGALRANSGLYFGDRQAGSITSFGGVFTDGWLWSRPLGFAEVQHLYERPNDMLTPRSVMVSIPVSTAVETPASVTEAAESSDSFQATIVSPQAVTEAAVSDDTFSANTLIVSAVTEDALSGDTFVGTLVTSASVTEDAVSDDTFGGALLTTDSVTEDAESSDTFLASVFKSATVTEGSESGDTFAGALGVVANTSDGAESGDTFSNVLVAPLSISDGAVSNDTMDGIVAGGVAVTEASQSSDAFTFTVITSDSVSEAAESSDSFEAITWHIGSVTEGGLAGSAYVASIIPGPVDVSEGAESSDTFSATLASVVSITEAATASDAFSSLLILAAGIETPNGTFTVPSRDTTFTLPVPEELILQTRDATWRLL